MALTCAMQEGNFLRQSFSDMSGSVNKCVILDADNQGAIALPKNPVHHQRSKNIDVKYHFIRSEVEDGIVLLVYVPTEDNVADIFSKPVSKNKFLRISCIRGVP